MSDSSRPRSPWPWSLLVSLGVIGLYIYLARPAEPVHDLALAGNTAFLALGRAGLAIVDTTNPESPRELSVFDTLGRTMAVAVDGEFAYLADGPEGLRILDIALPWAPVEVGAYDTPGSASDVAIAGNLAFLADGERGLLVVDVSDKANPVPQGQIEGRIRRVAVQGEFVYSDEGGRALRVVRVVNPRRLEQVALLDVQSRIENFEVFGDRLYLAAGGAGLIILDIADPAQPNVIQIIPQPGPVRDIGVVGDIFAYLAEGEAGLRVLDIADEQAVVEIGAYGVPLEANQVALGDGRVYLADQDVGLYVLDAQVNVSLETLLSDENQRGNAQDVVVDDRFAYVASAGQGLRVIDIRNPGETEEVTFFDSDGDAVGVALSGDFIYLADGQSGWRVLFLADPEGAPEVQEIVVRDTPGEANYVTVRGQLAYVADGSSGLRIFNLADPAAPVEIGAEDTPGSAAHVAVLGDYAYVADGEAGLRVINVLDPVRPAEVGFYDSPGEARAVVVTPYSGPIPGGGTPASGGGPGTSQPFQVLAYLADGSAGLRVVDVTDPRNPREVTFYDPYEDVLDLELRSDTLYIAARNQGFRVLEVTDLTRIGEVGFLDTPGEARALALGGTLAYVADHSRGLRIINIADPGRPIEAGFFDEPRVVRHVMVSGDYGYLADAERGFRIADISQPGRTREIGHYDQGGLVEDFDVQGNLVYTAQTTGLHVVDVSDPRNPSLAGTFGTQGRAAAVDVEGNLAYIVSGEFGLTIADISQTDSIQAVGLYDTPGNAQAVFVSDIYAYIADGEAGLEIVNVANPRDPKTASVIDQFQDVRSVVVVDNFAFLADGPNGIWVIDVEKPVTPQTIGYVDTPGTALDLDVAGVYLFVADAEGGLQVVYILEPEKPTIIGAADLRGLSLDLDAEARGLEEGEADRFLAFVAKGDRGLEILAGAETVLTTLRGVYQTPGMAPFTQVARDGYPLFARPGTEKSARTVRSYLFDLGVMGGLGFLFWLAFFAQFVLPLQRLGDRWKAFDRLFLHFFKAHGAAIRIENGRIVQRPGEAKRSGPGVILLDTASAAVLRSKTAFQRVVGPGVVFTDWGEYLHQEAVDLHVRIHPTPPLGPDPGEDPFAPQRKSRIDGESDDAYQARQKRRMETSGLTRDGVEVVARILAIVKTKGEPSQGGTQFGFDRLSVQLAITREGVVPQELRNMPWYEIPAYLAVDVWREYLSKFSLSDLYDTLAAVLPGEEVWSTGSNGQGGDPPWLSRGETGMETVQRLVRQRLSQSQVDELDASGRPTGRKQESREFRILNEMGIRILKVSISGVRFPQAVESQLVHQWLSTWLARAKQERESIESRRNRCRLAGEEESLLNFAKESSADLALRLFDADGRPISLDQAGLPDRVDSLEMLLAGTQKWLHNRPQLLQQLQAESEELDRLLAWVGGKKP